MAVWFIESWGHYTVHTYGVPGTFNTGVQVLRKWTATWGSLSFGAVNASGMSIDPFSAPHRPGQGARLSSVSAGLQKTRPGSVTDTALVGAWVLFESTPSSNAAFIIVADTTEQVSVRTDGSGGHFTISRNGTTLATSANTFALNTWYWVEFKTKINNSTGTYELRVNGTAWIGPATGQNTRATANNQFQSIAIAGVGSGTTIRFGSLYFGDTTGGVNDDFLGPMVAVPLRPAAAGNYSQFTPNGGVNFGNVNEDYSDEDQSFNQSSTAGHKDSFPLDDMPYGSGSVAAIQHLVLAKQDAGAQRVLRPIQRSSGTDYAGTSVNLSTSYQLIREVVNTNPATSAAYTIANINDAEFGYELVS